MTEIIGSCLGASSISFVRIKNENGLISIKDVLTVLHNGNPKQIFREKLNQFAAADKSYHGNIPVVVTGRKFRNLLSLQIFPSLKQ